MNEYAHDATDDELKGLVLQVTGLEASSSTFGAIVGSFKAVKAFADFAAETDPPQEDERESAPADDTVEDIPPGGSVAGLNLGYTINLHLPQTSDIAVFDAIFRSLREHLLPKQ